MEEGMWDYLEHLTGDLPQPMLRDNHVSWKVYKTLFPKHSMLLQQWGIGHAQFIWNLRENRKLIEPFSQLYSVDPEDLLVSFDGASFHFPPETLGTGWYTGKGWLHTDQSYTRNKFMCVQSWVTAREVNAGDATLTFLESSNNFHAAFAKEFDIHSTSDWFKLDKPQTDFYLDRGCTQKCIKCPAGSMVFWDSRTIHAGQECLRQRAKPNLRCVVYLCYTPRSMATEALLKKKREAFESLRTTNHYPHKPKLFPVVPHTYGAPIPSPLRSVQRPVVGTLGELLAGGVYPKIQQIPQVKQVLPKIRIKVKARAETDT